MRVLLAVLMVAMLYPVHETAASPLDVTVFNCTDDSVRVRTYNAGDLSCAFPRSDVYVPSCQSATFTCEEGCQIDGTLPVDCRYGPAWTGEMVMMNGRMSSRNLMAGRWSECPCHPDATGD